MSLQTVERSKAQSMAAAERKWNQHWMEQDWGRGG